MFQPAKGRTEEEAKPLPTNIRGRGRAVTPEGTHPPQHTPPPTIRAPGEEVQPNARKQLPDKTLIRYQHHHIQTNTVTSCGAETRKPTKRGTPKYNVGGAANLATMGRCQKMKA